MGSVYASLQLNTPGEIRLLDISPGEDGDDIETTLYVVSLDSPDITCEGLSYTWGTPLEPLAIKCNGCESKVTRNLHLVLRRL